MTTIAFNNANIATSHETSPSLYSRFTKNREAAAKAHVTRFLAGLTDSHLMSLGFDAADIVALRRGEHRLPKPVRYAA